MFHHLIEVSCFDGHEPSTTKVKNIFISLEVSMAINVKNTPYSLVDNYLLLCNI
jgi:hypothetical protein